MSKQIIENWLKENTLGLNIKGNENKLAFSYNDILEIIDLLENPND